MVRSLRTVRAYVAVAAIVIVQAIAVSSWAQTPTPPTPPSPNNQPVNPLAPAGVIVDADGVLRTQTFSDPGGALIRRRLSDAKAALDPKIATRSKSRKVSLTRLEKAIAARAAEGKKPTDEMLALAGLTRVRNVFVYPDSGDVVVAGPAEGWVKDISGRVVGMQSGRPVVELQDLVAALRTYPPGKQQGQLIGCSIDATPEGLKAMQQFLAQNRTPSPDQAEYIAEGLRTSLGLQKVRIEGVSPNTHFAQVMVEADYRMKLIGIGLERPPIQLTSWVDRASPAAVSRNAMQRWYFVPDYKCVRASEDRLAMELVGDGVKLVGANEVVQSDGKRKAAGGASGPSASFVNSFTKKYPELAARSPVFAQLRNLIDLSVAAAYMQQNDSYGKAQWEMATFGDEAKFPIETYNAPVEVETAVNVVWKQSTLMTPIGGGVTVRAHEALDDENLLADEGDKVDKLHQATTLENLSEGQWWWD